MIHIKKLELEVMENKKITLDVQAIKLDLGGNDFAYKPGQYVNMTLEVENDPKGNTRQFSIASSPTEDFLMFATKISDSPFKQKFSKLEKGDVVKVRGPFGQFILEEDPNKQHVMLSGGIGITPLRAMIKYATDKKLPLKIVLLYSNKTPEEIAFSEEFEKWEKQNENLKIVNTITRPEESKEKWEGKTGRIDDRMIREFVPDFKKAEFYVVGPPGMVDAMVDILEEMKISEEQINVEHFTGY